MFCGLSFLEYDAVALTSFYVVVSLLLLVVRFLSRLALDLYLKALTRVCFFVDYTSAYNAIIN